MMLCTGRMAAFGRWVRSPIRGGPCDLNTVLDPAFPYGEDLLQFIWAAGLFNVHGLRTTDGGAIEVLDPGRIQRNSGPDLVDARIRIQGQLWAGNVEVHACSSEWDAHGHQTDPAYENVILHVVHEHDSEVRTRSGRVLPTLELHTRIDTAMVGSHQRSMNARGFVPCSHDLGRIAPDRWSPWLERLAIERLERRSDGLLGMLRSNGGDIATLLFIQLARAFGLKVNADPFGMLANSVPIQVARRVADDVFRMEALLFGQAGLLQVDFVDEYPRSLQQEHRLLAGLHGLRPAPMASWKFGRMRPVNFPTIRIAQLAQVLVRIRGDLLDLLTGASIGDLRTLLDVIVSDYWMDHFTFDRPAEPIRKRLGRSGVDHIIINAIVPVLYTMGRFHGERRPVDRAMELLGSLPAEGNSVLASWASLGVKAGNATCGQALLELKDRYCSKRRCLNCAIGNHLLGTRVSVIGSC